MNIPIINNLFFSFTIKFEDNPGGLETDFTSKTAYVNKNVIKQKKETKVYFMLNYRTKLIIVLRYFCCLIEEAVYINSKFGLQRYPIKFQF